MLTRDGFRAQYFLPLVDEQLSLFMQEAYVNEVLVDSQRALEPFLDNLSTELDQMLLPTVVYEVREAARIGRLVGESREARYESFFVRNGSYTQSALELPDRYPFLFQMLTAHVETTFRCLARALRHFRDDLGEIRAFLGGPTCQIEAVASIGDFDRHRGSQVLCLHLSHGQKILHKEVDLRPDVALADFVQSLDLPWGMHSVEALPRQEYGWLKFVECKPCGSVEDVRQYFLRAGAMLSVAEALNYTDGHAGNILAHGAFPVILDGETLFQNYPVSQVMEKNVLSTMILQKIYEGEKKLPIVSGLQSSPRGRVDNYCPFAICDQTDEIEVRYRYPLPDSTTNLPRLSGGYQNAEDYIEECAEGYAVAYDRISDICGNDRQVRNLCESVSDSQIRIIMRPTVAYAYLIRRIQQPDLCSDERKAKQYLWSKLRHAPFADYEVEDILRLNVPYFHHQMSGSDLFDGFGNCYPDFFGTTSQEALGVSLRSRSPKRRNSNVDIIRNQLEISRREKGLAKII